MENRFLCKAKKVENKKRTEWVQGYYAVICSKPVIIKNQSKEQDLTDYGRAVREGEVIAIAPFSLCRCTGLKDENGKLIWENDIVTLPDEADTLFTVYWDEDTARFCMEGETLVCDFSHYWGREIEVIGNIFDNPELLAGETEE